MKLLSLCCFAAVSVQGPLVSCSLFKSNGAALRLTDNERFFVTEVKPVLERNCLRCHNGTVLPASVNLSDGKARGAKKGSQRYILPGDPDHSLLVTAISRMGTHPLLMPKLTLSLTDDEIGVLREWIEDGAAWPGGSEGRLKPVSNPENP